MFSEVQVIHAAFILVFAILFKPLRKVVVDIVLQYVSEIRSTLQNAENKKSESYSSLQSLTEESNKVLKEAENLVNDAKQQAELILREGKQKIRDKNERKLIKYEKQFEIKLKTLTTEVQKMYLTSSLEALSDLIASNPEEVSRITKQILDQQVQQIKKLSHQS